MYLALIALYLITCYNFVEYQRDLSVREQGYHLVKERYRDLDDNVFDMSKRTKSCLVKCCDADQFLDKNGTCHGDKYFENMYMNDINLGSYNWSVAMKKIKGGIARLEKSFTIIKRERKTVKRLDNNYTYATILTPDGSLHYFREDEYSPNIKDVWPLYFCVDYELPVTKRDYVFQLLNTNYENGQSEQEIFTRKALSVGFVELGIGLLISFVVILTLIFRARRKLLVRHLTFSYCAYFCTLMLAYLLKIIHLEGIKVGLFEIEECNYFSPLLYFLLLSAFCWPLMLNYDLARTMRTLLSGGISNFKQTKKDLDVISLGRYLAFSWGIPFLMTMLAFVLEKQHFAIFDIVKPPFDSCFENEIQTTLYFHVPISILVVVNTIIVLVCAYNVRKLLKVLGNSCLTAETSRIRSIVSRKMIKSIMMLFLLNMIPYLPLVLYYVLLTSHMIISFVMFIIFVSKKNMFQEAYKRYMGTYNKETKKYEYTITNSEPLSTYFGVRKMISLLIVFIFLLFILPSTAWLPILFSVIVILVLWFAILIRFLFGLNIFGRIRIRKYKKLEDDVKYSPLKNNSISIISNNDLDESKGQLNFLKVIELNEIISKDVTGKEDDVDIKRDLNISMIEEQVEKDQSKLVSDLEKVLTD